MSEEIIQENPVAVQEELRISMEIQPLIKTIRGRQVLIDKDLARLYGVETKRLNEQVKRNPERFPDHFMFQLTAEECSRSQFATLNINRGQNIKYLPYAFTEQGVAMLSAVLKSPFAVTISIRIMEAFVAMRQFLSNTTPISQRLETIEYNQLEMQQHLTKTDKRIDKVFQLMESSDNIPKQGIFFDGQIYDAYTFVSDLIRSANSKIVLIDNYIDDTVLTMLDKRKSGVSAKIYTAQISRELRLDLDRHNSQYPHIEIGICRIAHDRFFIIDETVYHIGASIKDLGKRLFGFSLMHELNMTDLLARIE